MNEEVFAIQTKEEARTKTKKLPSYVKCAFCGEKPKLNDWLGQVIRDTTYLAHQSCAKQRGLVFGLNAGKELDIRKKGDES